MFGKIVVIGIAGADRSGKSTLASRFKEHGYHVAEVSSLLMEIAKPLGWNGTKDSSPHGRLILIKLGRAIKKEFGEQFLVDRVIVNAVENGHAKIVVPSIRTEKEAHFIRNHHGKVVKISRPDEECHTIPEYIEALNNIEHDYEIINNQSLDVFLERCIHTIHLIEKENEQ